MMNAIPLIASAAGVAAVITLAWIMLYQDTDEPAPVTELGPNERQMSEIESARFHEVQILGGSGGQRCIEIDDCYYPASISIFASDAVFWNNLDDAIHTVTSGTGTDGHDGMFDSDLIFSGSTFGYAFDEVGVYEYYCILHPWMTGNVTVTESKSAAYTPLQYGTSEPVQYTHDSKAIELPFGTSVPGCEEADRCYIPARINVAGGTSVFWTNEDDGVHTVTSGTVTDGPSGMFDTGLFLSGETFSYTFEDAGTFEYYCKVHPWMTGSVMVG